MCVVAAVLTVLNLLLKLPCTDTAPSVLPRDAVVSRFGCFSDVEFLWDVRQLASHVFPYVTGSDIGNGTVEYPTLTGVWIWLTALPVDTARGFLVVTAAVAVVIVVVVTLLLARIAGRRAWIWAATPRSRSTRSRTGTCFRWSARSSVWSPSSVRPHAGPRPPGTPWRGWPSASAARSSSTR